MLPDRLDPRFIQLVRVVLLIEKALQTSFDVNFPMFITTPENFSETAKILRSSCPRTKTLSGSTLTFAPQQLITHFLFHVK
ncbi:MAG: hypothetical protein DWB57_15700 [Candidatus Brocadia sp.]|nr:hypothetical protein [Candidatus Brocadia sp.]